MYQVEVELKQIHLMFVMDLFFRDLFECPSLLPGTDESGHSSRKPIFSIDLVGSQHHAHGHIKLTGLLAFPGTSQRPPIVVWLLQPGRGLGTGRGYKDPAAQRAHTAAA